MLTCFPAYKIGKAGFSQWKVAVCTRNEREDPGFEGISIQYTVICRTMHRVFNGAGIRSVFGW